MKKKILFTGGGGAATEFLWRYLSSRYEVYFADADLNAIDDKIPEENKVKIPFANQNDFIEVLAQQVTELAIDILIPSVDEELIIVGENLNKFTAKVLLPEVEFIRSMLDKLTSIEAIAGKGLVHPKTFLVNNSKLISFPQIIKPRTGRGSRGVSILNNSQEVQAYMVLNQAEPDEIISQELATGVEYTVLIAANMNSELKAIVPVKIEQKKGITIRAKTEQESKVIAYCREFQNKFKATGVYNLQCILTENGQVIPFEINPRISTTFCLGIAAGFDPFDILFDDKNNSEIFYPKSTFTLKRNWHNNITEVK
ncbi:ATP-grasp domain-containing protein [Colwellia sp. 4_MG-2023]|uniref:ATP-grasp domain-containing protein n=1 Tax=unclassified Colwellia TaxID=196834 RepID=UPI0026E21624|nr:MULTISPECIES: ATP-grasp domain-containing protein [unclassified Colwellia]MDO6507253.1 ATP-grasp domain-containing protein [Colwellia sp. 5_MG-2023]MDO6555403.1 ATP-grasp domain-containing protein [Colwellia sp. 4_MG-2023]